MTHIILAVVILVIIYLMWNIFRDKTFDNSVILRAKYGGAWTAYDNSAAGSFIPFIREGPFYLTIPNHSTVRFIYTDNGVAGGITFTGPIKNKLISQLPPDAKFDVTYVA